MADPVTDTGELRFVVVPSPNSPLVFFPHSHKLPLFLIAAVASYPHDTADHNSKAEPTIIGELLLIIL